MLTRLWMAIAVTLLAFGCSHAKTKNPQLSKLEGKKVALVDVEGETTARQVVEVALVNQLVQRGTFLLVSKQDVQAARDLPGMSPVDDLGIAKKAGADFALAAKVLEFDGTTRSGVSSETVNDSQLAEERGTHEAMTERLYPVKSLTGKVRVELTFTNVATGEIRSGIAEKQDTLVNEGKTEAVHLPPKLGYLENLSNEAFRDFFERYSRD